LLSQVYERLEHCPSPATEWQAVGRHWSGAEMAVVRRFLQLRFVLTGSSARFGADYPEAERWLLSFAPEPLCIDGIRCEPLEPWLRNLTPYAERAGTPPN
jgi:hypothetical protein